MRDPAAARRAARPGASPSDPEKLGRTTPSWTEFQPRIGFAYDVSGNGRTVVRGGYGIFYDQLFQNLTPVLALAERARDLLDAPQPDELGGGRRPARQLPLRRRSRCPRRRPRTTRSCPPGSFGRINDPDVEEPYVQKFSIGFQKAIGDRWSLSSDFVHTLGPARAALPDHQPAHRGASATRPTRARRRPRSRCERGVNSRYFDEAFVARRPARQPARADQHVHHHQPLDLRQLDHHAQGPARAAARSSLSYVLASSRSWGGQPTASYSGNGIAIDPENQFNEEEFGPTRLDERHRIVASGVFELPLGLPGRAHPAVRERAARTRSTPASTSTGTGSPPSTACARARARRPSSRRAATRPPSAP